MTTAIVTITCPSCGGRVEGIAATSEEQTVKCTFCGTDLHIPRIGAVVHERVVREVVHEVESAPAIDTNDAGLLRPKRNPLAGVIVACVMLPLLGIFMCVQNQQAKDDVDHFEQQQAAEKSARDACEAACKAQCATAGDKETGKWNAVDGVNDSNLEQQMKDTDILVCTTDCEMKQNCIGLPRSSH